MCESLQLVAEAALQSAALELWLLLMFLLHISNSHAKLIAFKWRNMFKKKKKKNTFQATCAKKSKRVAHC